jgi:N-acetylmuramoyl-L-alanine amidase
VLFLSSMPSVLVESGFVTHAKEAKRLRDDRYVNALAEQIAQGLADYRGAAVISRAP